MSYKVLQSGTVIASPTTTSDAVTGLTPSTAYSFTVEATDAAGTSAASSAVNVTTSASSCTTKPSAPTGLAASGTTDSTTNLSWNAVTPPNGCSISYSITGGPSTLTTNATSDTEGGLTPSTSYTFSLTATDFAGSSPATTVTVKTSAPSTLMVAGWYEEWGTYYANANVADLQNMRGSESSAHLIYAFAKPAANGSNVSCSLADSYADYQKNVPQVPGATPATAPLQGNFGALVQLKQLHPNLKVLISIGGWNPPTYNQLFDTASSTAAQRQAFVSSMRPASGLGQYRLGCLHRNSLRWFRHGLGVPERKREGQLHRVDDRVPQRTEHTVGNHTQDLLSRTAFRRGQASDPVRGPFCSCNEAFGFQRRHRELEQR